MSLNALRAEWAVSLTSLKAHLLTASLLMLISFWSNPEMTGDDRTVFIAVPLLLLAVAFRVPMVLVSLMPNDTKPRASTVSPATFKGWERLGYLVFLMAIIMMFPVFGFLLALPVYAAVGMTAFVWDAFFMSIVLIGLGFAACLLAAGVFVASNWGRTDDDMVQRFKSRVWPAVAAAAFRL